MRDDADGARICQGEGISGLRVVPAKTGVGQEEWRPLSVLCAWLTLDRHCTDRQVDTACVKVRQTVQQTLMMMRC